MAELAGTIGPAERELKYALELNPNYVAGHEELIWFLAWSGSRAEALSEFATMGRLDLAYTHCMAESEFTTISVITRRWWK